MNIILEEAALEVIQSVQKDDRQAAFTAADLQLLGEVIKLIFRQCNQSPGEMQASAKTATGFLGWLFGRKTRQTVKAAFGRKFVQHQGRDRRDQLVAAMLATTRDAKLERLIAVKQAALNGRH